MDTSLWMSSMNSFYLNLALSCSFVVLNNNLSFRHSSTQSQSHFIPVLQFCFLSSEQMPVDLQVSPHSFFLRWSMMNDFVIGLISPFWIASYKHSGLGSYISESAPSCITVEGILEILETSEESSSYYILIFWRAFLNGSTKSSGKASFIGIGAISFKFSSLFLLTSCGRMN